jgi:hypothetical protein
MESRLEPCECGGSFRKGGAPHCPNCDEALSAELAASYIEKNAPGSMKGWRWQKNWKGLYCMVVEGRRVDNNWLKIEGAIA